MAIKIKELIKKLEEKDQESNVEFIVVKTDDELVVMDVSTRTKSMIKFLKMFGS